MMAQSRVDKENRSGERAYLAWNVPESWWSLRMTYGKKLGNMSLWPEQPVEPNAHD